MNLVYSIEKVRQRLVMSGAVVTDRYSRGLEEFVVMGELVNGLRCPPRELRAQIYFQPPGPEAGVLTLARTHFDE